MSTTIESLELEVISNSKNAASGIDALAQSLTKLKNSTKNLGLSGVATEVGKIGTAMKKVADENGKASASFTDLYHKIKAGAKIIGNLGKKIWSAIGESNDYTENMNLFTVAMGEYATEAKEYADTVSNAMGIDTSEWVRAQGVFMTMATGFGVAGDRAAIMSKNLTQLGYDLSSFYNIDVENAMQKLKSGLAGELEPLRAIGYDLSQAKLEATALELGIDKTVSSMTQAEKAQLRYYAIMTQVTTAQGDMARTLDDPANQIRVLKAELNMAAREIGNVFIPALNAVLPYAIALMRVIGNLASSIAGLVGYEAPDLSESTSKVVENTDAMQENLEDAQKEAKKLKSYMLGFDELNVINPNEGSVSEDALGSGFEFELPEYDFMSGLVESKVSKIVDDMKEWLGLTEDINSWADLLSTNFGNILVSVGLIGVGITSWKIASVVKDTKKLSTVVKGLKNTLSLMSIALKSMGIAAVIGAATAGAIWLFNNTEDTITKIGAVVSAASLSVGAILAFTGINLPLGIALMAAGAISMGTAIALNTNKLSDEVKGVIAIISGAVSVALLAVGAILAFTGVNIPLGIALMGGGALVMGTAIIPRWNELSDSVKNTLSIIMAAVGGAALAIGAILAFTGVGIPLGIGLMLVGAASLGTSIALNWNAIVDALRGPVGLVTGIISGALLALGAILLFTGVGIPLGIGLMLAGAAGLGTVVALNWNYLTDKVREVWNGIVAICSQIGGWFNDNVITPVVEFFRGLWESVSGFFVSLWNGIVGVWNTVATWFNTYVIQPIVNLFEGVVLRISQFFEGCWLIIQAVWLVTSTWFNENVITPIVNFFKALWEAVSGFFTQLWSDIVAIWNVVANWFNETVIQPVVGVFNVCKDAIQQAFTAAWTFVTTKWNQFTTWVNETIIQPVVNNFNFCKDAIVSAFQAAWDWIKEKWSTLGKWFKISVINPVKQVFEEACEAIGVFFSYLWLGIRRGAASAFNGLIGGIESLINWIIRAINRLIGGFDKIVQWAANVLGADWGGMSLITEITLGRIDVPMYAEGGFPEQGQMFIAREAGAEMVGNIGRRTAVANNDQIVSGIAGGVAQANEEQNALLREQNSLLRALLEKDSGVYLDGKNLTNSVEKYQRERGRVLITGGVM